MPKPTRCASAIAFNFEDLLCFSDEAVLERFQLVRKVNPTLVPPDFQPDACRVSRTREALTLHFYQRQTPEELGPEILRFSFQPAG